MTSPDTPLSTPLDTSLKPAVNLDVNATVNPSSAEWLSALFDGELSADEIAGGNLIEAKLAHHADWDSYQLIGQALKGVSSASASALQGADPAFLQRLNARLGHEKIALLPQLATGAAATINTSRPAANEGVFRWKLVAGFSSLAAALVVAWSFVGSTDSSTGAQLAQRQAAEQVVVTSPQGPMVRDARLEELMAAHKQLGGSSLQAPSGFLRNAGFENPQRGER